jgi:hypothetical protein
MTSGAEGRHANDAPDKLRFLTYSADMKSPFPGMDPYLEKWWEGVHQTLVIYARDAMQPQLPDDLWALAEDRVYIESDSGRMRQIVPDVHVSRVYHEPKSQSAMLKEGCTAAAEPVLFELHDLEITESYIKIVDRAGGKVVTVIEFLSPANKSAGPGQNSYLEKQAEVLRSDTNLVEVDLIRAGERMLALPRDKIPDEHRTDYLACISPAWKRKLRELYPMPLRQRLAVLPVPLRQHDSRISLDLQELIEQAYSKGRYDRLDYTVELQPPLSAADAAWANALLKAAGNH